MFLDNMCCSGILLSCLLALTSKVSVVFLKSIHQFFAKTKERDRPSDCGTCFERKEAFKLAGIPDPTK
jgi:7-cyano-7-deazaguanine synthase in queuosine biosynthesis